VGIIFPAESNLVMFEGHEAVVGDGHTMGVTGEIAQHMMRTAEGWLGVDDPVLTEQDASDLSRRLQRSIAWPSKSTDGPSVGRSLVRT
jgi:hypothetical protein